MSYLEIKGGIPLRGTLQANGNKNEVLPMLAAALLTDEPVTYTNVPGISDVETMLHLAGELGCHYNYDKANKTVTLHAKNLKSSELSRASCTAIRTSILFVAPLLHRLGEAILWPPGGDVIGRRRLDVHFDGLASMGCKIPEENECPYLFRTEKEKLQGADFFLSEASVTGTEQLLMAAVLAQGTTILTNVASEPHVQNLAKLLNAMGGQIEGIGSNRLIIQGVDKLHGTTFRIGEDFVEVGSYLAMAAMTGGELTITDITPSHYRKISQAFEKLGVHLSFSENSVYLAPNQSLTAQRERSGGMLTIDDGPWPHFPTDLMSILVVLATQIDGTVLFFEKMFESRMYFIDRLVAMGANAVICDPHRAVISGKTQLHGIELTTPDIRAGVAMLAAALCAKGTSRIDRIHLIDRGYDAIEKKLASLGACIQRFED